MRRLRPPTTQSTTGVLDSCSSGKTRAIRATHSPCTRQVKSRKMRMAASGTLGSDNALTALMY
ncbi:MAG: hypothetical protein QF435_15070 [Arenicellales bacterium]|nr:hypothetical protein [Arenicellales bacterium]